MRKFNQYQSHSFFFYQHQYILLPSVTNFPAGNFHYAGVSSSPLFVANVTHSQVRETRVVYEESPFTSVEARVFADVFSFTNFSVAKVLRTFTSTNSLAGIIVVGSLMTAVQRIGEWLAVLGDATEAHFAG